MNATADFNFDCFNSECVVVSRVSLNKKRAKRNLQKIAHANVSVPVTPATSSNTSNKRMAPAAPARRIPAPAAMETRTAARCAKAVTCMPTLQRTPQVIQIVARSQAAVPTVFSALPDAILASIFDATSAGACAAVCRDLNRVVWENDSFWHALCGQNTGPLARDTYRRSAFALEDDWATAFQSSAAVDAPLAVLTRASRLAGGLTCVERGEAGLFIEAVCTATRRADGGEKVVELLDIIGLKVAQREGRVFHREALEHIGEAREDALETGILARLGAAVDADMEATFDPFEPETVAPVVQPAAWIVDGPLPALILNIPAEAAKPRSTPKRWADMDSDDEDMDSTDCEDDADFFSAADDEEFSSSPMSKKLGSDFAEDFLDLLR